MSKVKQYHYTTASGNRSRVAGFTIREDERGLKVNERIPELDKFVDIGVLNLKVETAEVEDEQESSGEKNEQSQEKKDGEEGNSKTDEKNEVKPDKTMAELVDMDLKDLREYAKQFGVKGRSEKKIIEGLQENDLILEDPHELDQLQEDLKEEAEKQKDE